MNWRPMKTAPRDREIWLLGMVQPWKDYVCHFQGQAGWNPDLKVWEAFLCDVNGNFIVVAPIGWRPLAKWRALSRAQEQQKQKELLALIKRVHKEDGK